MDEYVKPGDVHSPKRNWRLFHVLFDGGPDEASLAIGRWDDQPVLAMRWNGKEGNRIGNPQSRGLPTWLIVPGQYAQAILEARDFSHPKLIFARDFLELRRVYFLSRCPTPGCQNFGELTLASYRSDELQKYRAELDRGELKFYCIFCNEGWHPSSDEKKRLRAEMEMGWSLYLEKVRSYR